MSGWAMTVHVAAKTTMFRSTANSCDGEYQVLSVPNHQSRTLRPYT